MIKLNIQMFGGRGASSSGSGGIISKSQRSLETFRKRGVKIGNKAPAGWKKVTGATTAPRGYTWYSNGEDLFGGKYQHMLVKNRS